MKRRLSVEYKEKLSRFKSELIYKTTLNRRKYDYCANEEAQNYLFIFGNKPGKLLLARTTMVHEISNSMNNDFDRETLSLKIPSFFDCFKA